MKSILLADFRISNSSGGDSFVSGLWHFLLVAACVLIIYGLGVWIMRSFTVPPFAQKVWDLVFVVLGAAILINFLLGLAGHPMFQW